MRRISFLVVVCAFIFVSCRDLPKLVPEEEYQALKSRIVREFSGKAPVQWKEDATGVVTRFRTSRPFVALTLDACGSEGDGFDSQLLMALMQHGIPATVFVSGRWIDKYPQHFQTLASNSLFEIANHGAGHKPCSVDGKSAYGIAGTKDIGEIVDEIELNGRKIALLTGRKPRFYRSGTAYYDEVGVAVARRLGYTVAGFSILGDAGATYSASEVKEALLKAKPGDIIICHMNHPESGTAEGVIEALPELQQKGLIFVRLSEVLSQ